MMGADMMDGDIMGSVDAGLGVVGQAIYSPLCYDSDNNVNTTVNPIFVAGNGTIRSTGGQWLTKNDVCDGRYHLYEQSCSGGRSVLTRYSCDEGCVTMGGKGYCYPLSTSDEE